ncbi:TPA: elongation factor 4 [Candidatus Berkelbacteria bacterium]|uniref:Elongation factor 4 n=1 Tax=Berkelbacteria bacterium GW2011_GWE1_39_12 TaxID=1618337 RepID=A0A0G4B4R7_9BACT|nr:MAG: GTP-binding protein LepA, GTP-binding protein LepA [Berkelbacteria bacterium GW2011_GWE1_39_12]HBO60989.1 elongation factor 4 [Candidatus Berkelbacteria bacterium]
MVEQSNIRNFVIIAHIDHGKSTLADRMIEVTKTVEINKIKPQMLDTMDLERERGITIKLQPVRMNFHCGGNDYILNLIDTPGHVDFSYEVSRSLAAVEGAVLVVDATKGIQAQTLANLQHAIDNNLIIIPVINKIDLPNAQIEEVEKEISELLKIDQNQILKVSAKTGQGVTEILEKIISLIPAPKGKREAPFKALIFDSVYDSYRGVIAYVKVFEGRLEIGDKINFFATKKIGETVEVGEFKLKYQATDELVAGEIGYIVTGAKSISEVQVGDTIASQSPEDVSPIEGYKKPQSFVFASFFTVGSDVNHLRTALDKLVLNDSSLNFSPENSEAFGHGFRCGFLGLLHLEIVKERLEREYNLDLVITQPSVEYKVHDEGSKIEYEEPWVNLEIITPSQYLGQVMELIQNKRAVYQDTKYFGDRAVLYYECPLSEIIVQFYDQLKSVSSGYASQNYEMIGWRQGDLAKLDVLVAGDKVDEFGKIVPRTRVDSEAKSLALKLKNLIPKQMFEVSIQIVIGGKIIARENISAMKKDVIAKLYGGDITRKNKLLKKQAAGKKKMKQMGRLQIPDEVFMEILKQ